VEDDVALLVEGEFVWRVLGEGLAVAEVNTGSASRAASSAATATARSWAPSATLTTTASPASTRALQSTSVRAWSRTRSSMVPGGGRRAKRRGSRPDREGGVADRRTTLTRWT
jgi:hypothetical protein